MNFFKKFRKKEKPVSLSPEDVELIVHEFGVFLVCQPLEPGYVADEQRLPYPKKLIKQALLQGIKVEIDDDMRTKLKDAFLELAGWQEGVGPRIRQLDDNWMERIEAERLAQDEALDNALNLDRFL